MKKFNHRLFIYNIINDFMCCRGEIYFKDFQ